MRPKGLVAFAFFASSLVLDQATKYFVKAHFRLYERVIVIPDFLNITYVSNKGTAFGFFDSFGPKYLFVISVIALVMMILVYLRHGLKSADIAYGLALIVGGALGNISDRIRFGYVIDFIDVHYKSRFVWPTFNFADVVICIGVAMMLFGLLKTPQERTTEVEERRE